MNTKDYPELKPNCDCLRCLGCEKLSDPRFRGKYNCPNLVNSEKEEPFYYGSKYGNNN